MSSFYADIMMRREFLWSKQSVLAALELRAKEQLVRLHYVADSGDEERVAAIVAAARRRRVEVATVRGRQHLSKLMLRGAPSDRVPQNVLLECVPRVPLALSAPRDVDAILARSRLHRVALFLSGVTDPHNVAAVARAAVFFGLTDVILSEHGSAPLNDVVAVGSAGASEAVTFHLAHPRDIVSLPNVRVLAAVVPDASYERAVPVHALGAHVARAPSDQLTVLAFGSEGKGLGPRFVESPRVTPFFIAGASQSPLLDSLNVGVSVAVALSHLGMRQ